MDIPKELADFLETNGGKGFLKAIDEAPTEEDELLGEICENAVSESFEEFYLSADKISLNDLVEAASSILGKESSFVSPTFQEKDKDGFTGECGERHCSCFLCSALRGMVNE